MAVSDTSHERHGQTIPELDGLRGLAIAMVLVHHMGVFQDTGRYSTLLSHVGGPGWVGVDLFFVLSGFLITGILLRTKSQAHYLRNFYARRALRIFPLYFCYLAVWQLALGIHWVAPPLDQAISRDIPWVWLYATNLKILFSGDFLNVFLNHFWSLSVEEHFYFIWPTVVLFFDSSKLRKLCLWGILGVVALRCALVLGSLPGSAVYTLTPCRMDGFFIGGLAALLFQKAPVSQRLRRPAIALLMGCGAAVLASCIVNGSFTWSTGFMKTVGYTLTSLAFFALLTLTLLERGRGWLSHVFGSKPLRFLGKYSYALYVLHQPIYVFFESALPTTRLIEATGSTNLGFLIHSSISIALSIGAALISWNLLEMPFLRLKSLFEYRGAVQPAHSAVPAMAERLPVVASAVPPNLETR